MNAKKRLCRRPMRAGLWRSITGLLMMALVVFSGAVSADGPEPTQIPIPAELTLPVEDGAVAPANVNPKLDSALNQLLEAERTEGTDGARAFAETRRLVLVGRRVQVLLVTEAAQVEALGQEVEALGGQTQGAYEGWLQALVPMEALQLLAKRPEVQMIRDPWRPVELEPAALSSATTEGVAASHAAAWHTAGYRGRGVRVAVIDGGFTGYEALLGSELPSSVGTYDWTGSGMGGSVHGTACAEIVHDMAPEATMDLHRVGTVVGLGQAIDRAIADGVDVITMSLGWTLDGPGDGTGFLANLVEKARSNGIVYVTSAGNNAEVTWTGTFKNSGTNNYHAWDGATRWYNFLGTGTQCIIFAAGQRIEGGLHWDDWTAVNQDYDLHLYRWPGTGSTLYRVASSTEVQNGGVGQTPQEYIAYAAAGNNCYLWAVERKNSNRDVCLRLTGPKTGHFVSWTPALSLSYPADAPAAITVGAVNVDAPYALESYSSQGPTFGPGGACSGGATKPDIAAYANVSTASYSPDEFGGTSAATPHVAGAAALVLSAYPAYTPAQVRSFLEGRALDLGAGGKDPIYGQGRLYLGDPPSATTSTPTATTTRTYTATATRTRTPTATATGSAATPTHTATPGASPLRHAWLPMLIKTRATGTATPTITFTPTTQPPTRTATPTRTRTPTVSPTAPAGGIHGQVTTSGAAAPDIRLRLIAYNDVSWTAVQTTTTGIDGRYLFGGIPTLPAGQRYYVMFGPNDDDRYLYRWYGPDIRSYTAGASVAGGDFDIADVSLVSPPYGSTLPLPVTFTWEKRGVATDTYGWSLFDMEDDNLAWPTGNLGDEDQVTVTSLPPGAELNKEYGWFVWVYNGPDSFGSSYYYGSITFLGGEPAPTGGKAPAPWGEVRRGGEDLHKPRRAGP